MTLLETPQSPGNRISLTTVQRPPIQVASVTADATDLLKTTGSWEDMKASAVRIPTEWKTLSLSFYGYGDGTGAGDPDGTTFSYRVFLIDSNCGAQLITDGTGTMGKQQMSHNPATGAELNSGAVDTSYCWCDTITEANVLAERDVTYSDYEGADSIAAMHFDRFSAIGILVIIDDMTDQLVTSVTCLMNGHNA